MSKKINFRKAGILLLITSFICAFIVLIIELVSIKDLMDLRNLTFAGFVSSQVYVLSQLDISFNAITSVFTIGAAVFGIYKFFTGKCSSKTSYLVSLAFPIMFALYMLICCSYIAANSTSYNTDAATISFYLSFSFSLTSIVLIIVWFVLNLLGNAKFNRELILTILGLDLLVIICLFISNGSMASALTITLLVFLMLQVIVLSVFVLLIKDIDEKPIRAFNNEEGTSSNNNNSKENLDNKNFSPSEKLIELKKLYVLGLLTDDEYEEKRKKYVDEL